MLYFIAFVANFFLHNVPNAIVYRKSEKVNMILYVDGCLQMQVTVVSYTIRYNCNLHFKEGEKICQKQKKKLQIPN